MRELLAEQLLEIWERGSAQSLNERALILLQAVCPDLETDALARLSVGRRDGLLMSVRESTFGPRVVAVTDCPGCCEQLEFGFALDDIRVAGPSLKFQESFTGKFGGYELRFRLPDSRDLLFAGDLGGVQAARDALLKRCVLSARRNGRKTSIDRLPATVVDQIEEQMSKLDAQANVQIELECPACRRGWNAAFDILTFFWNEFDAWAQRLLFEVHKLASAYGWRERDILNMSATRRNIYLNMVRG